MAQTKKEVLPEVPAEPVETPVETPAGETATAVCPNCNNSGRFCAVCSSREVVN